MNLFSDLILGAGTVFLEAEGELYEGKVMVAEVIRNRTMKKYASKGP
jgi:spore germination cell wall hydrolase CwlJ-like protein